MKMSRVLFVDDEGPILRSLQREFSADHDLSVAYSAEEAIRLLEGPGSFDVVISDVSMPEMNGLDFIAEIAPRYPYARFIVLTGNCDTETLERAAAMPEISNVLLKPSSRDAILEAISEAVTVA